MKNLLTIKKLKKLTFIAAAVFFPLTVMAHPGHLLHESTHSFLHIEHIIALSVIGITAYIVTLIRKK